MKLPNNLPIGAGQSAVEDICLRFSTADEVLQHLTEALGYQPMQQPRATCPVLTAEMLTTQDSQTYTNNYAEFKAWRDYYAEALARVSGLVLQYKNMLTMVEVQTKKVIREMAEAQREKPSLDAIKSRVLENPEYQGVLLELQRYTQAEKLLDAKFQSLDKSLAVISRQVEIRKLDFEQNLIAHNMPSRNMYPPRGF